MAKILLLGANGQVGYELIRPLMELGELILFTRANIDLADADSIKEALRIAKPDLVVNAAADTVVDRAETQFEVSRAINGLAPIALSEVCQEIRARLIHFSTDYVFDGQKRDPYTETDSTNPVNAYGRAKLEGEEAVLASDERNFVFRLSWVYSYREKNFALTMLRLAREGKPIRVVDDQIGSPSYAPHIAQAVAQVIGEFGPNEPGGLFHMTSQGHTSWHGFAQALFNEALGDRAPVVEPIPTSAYPTPAKRPAYSVLSSEKLRQRFGVSLPSWEEGVKEWAGQIGRQ